jgi:hypothetical protein
LKEIPPRDPIAAFERESRAARRVGQGSRCKCGERRPLALIPGSKPTICAACQREKLGRSLLDNHHPAGEANNPTTIPIPVNDHRAILNPEQYDWPQETWENPSGSPLLSGAACVRGYCETNNYMVAELLLRNAEMLEALDTFLKDKFGPEWWLGTDLERFAAKRKANGVVMKPAVSPHGPFTSFAPAAEQVRLRAQKISTKKRSKKMNVAAYISGTGQRDRLPLLDASLFRKLQKKGVVTGKITLCRHITSPKFKGLVMEFKSGTAKFAFLASFERWDIGSIARQLGSAETDDWVGQQVRFISSKGQKGREFINVENAKRARQ